MLEIRLIKLIYRVDLLGFIELIYWIDKLN
jgi:hypothetical protein